MDAAISMMQLRTLLDQTSACVAASDESGDLTMFSPGLEKLFGQSFKPVAESDLPEQFGLFDADGLHPLAPEDVPLARARAGEIIHDAAITARLPDRPLLHLICNGAPLRDDVGVIRGAIVVVTDVTAERAAMEKQAQIRRRLMDTISHEFRTSLTVLMGHVELLHDMGGDVPESVHRPLESIHAATWRLRHLIQTISDLVELERNRPVELEACDLGQLVRARVAELQDYASRRKVTVRCATDDAVRATLDPAKMGQAVLALLQIAITYAPGGSEVLVRVAGDADALRVRVCDLGRGSSAAERTLMLTAFEDVNHPPPDTGRGLGLTVARAVALAHGGDLDLADHDPTGICTTLTVPRVPGLTVPRVPGLTLPGS